MVQIISTTIVNEFLKIYRLGATCPSNYNPADYFIQLLAVVPGRETACRHSINAVCDKFQKSTLGIKLLSEVRTINHSNDIINSEKKYKSLNISSYKASWLEQFRAVLWRSWISVIKEPILIKVRLLQTIVSE